MNNGLIAVLMLIIWGIVITILITRIKKQEGK